jgi:hypothetical protein
LGLSFASIDSPTSSTTEGNSAFRNPNVARVHNSKHDLPEMQLQNPSTPTETSTQLSTRIQCNKLEALKQSPTTTCPIHSVLLAEYSADAYTPPTQSPTPLGGLTPMERYLAEGEAERYSLYGHSQSGTGDWRRYILCCCGV